MIYYLFDYKTTKIWLMSIFYIWFSQYPWSLDLNFSRGGAETFARRQNMEGAKYQRIILYQSRDRLMDNEFAAFFLLGYF